MLIGFVQIKDVSVLSCQQMFCRHPGLGAGYGPGAGPGLGSVQPPAEGWCLLAQINSKEVHVLTPLFTSITAANTSVEPEENEEEIHKIDLIICSGSHR